MGLLETPFKDFIVYKVTVKNPFVYNAICNLAAIPADFEINSHTTHFATACPFCKRRIDTYIRRDKEFDNPFCLTPVSFVAPMDIHFWQYAGQKNQHHLAYIEKHMARFKAELVDKNGL